MTRDLADFAFFKDLLQSPFNIRFFLIFCALFILCTVTGVLAHELGHLTVAEYLGYDTTLHYSRVDYENKELNEKMSIIYEKNSEKIIQGQNYEGKEEYEQMLYDYFVDSVHIYAAGPVQTMLRGTAGFMFLFFRQKSLKNGPLRWKDWIAVLLSLFWSRQVYLLLQWLSSGILFSARPITGDEAYLSDVLGLWSPTITVVTGIIGIAVLVRVIFRIIPTKYRTSFLTGGLTGSFAGHIIWLNILGPKVLP